jgi:hypothetical protein
MKKRGLSNTIAITLIVLMAIAAAIIIWAYVRSTVTESSERVYLQEKCFTTTTEMLNCEYGGLQEIWFATGLVKLKEGDSTKIKVTFYTEDGKSTQKDLAPISILETRKILPPTLLTEKPTYAIASPIVFNDDQTKSLTCTLSKRMVCNEITLPGNLCETPTFIEDIDPFVSALGDAEDYFTEHPDCERINADFDCNGVINFEDIDPFVSVLENGWLLCNRQTICDHVWSILGNPPSQEWWQNPAIINYFNQTCR